MWPPVSPERPASIAALRDAQRSGSTTAEEIVARHLERIASDPVGAVVESDAAAALSAARDVDGARAAGSPLGPLAGIPLTIKDSFAVAGMHASVGLPESRLRTDADARAVAALRAAGAVIVGKTNVPDMLDSYDTSSTLYGRTTNPWDPSRIAGGSSGGSAAAVAAGLSLGDLGSDLSGSIRVPSAWCGVYGHRPSSGVISKRGHLPWSLDAQMEPPTSAAGPIAGSAADLTELFEVLAGSVEAGPWRLDLPRSRVDSVRGVRVGLWLDAWEAPVDDETSGALLDFAARVTTAGATVLAIPDPGLGSRESAALFERLVDIELSHGGSGGVSAADIWAAREAQAEARATWETIFDSVDVVVAPVTPFVAPPSGDASTPENRSAVGRWSCISNLSQGPSTVVPLALGARSGMPIGAQIMARHGDDRSTLGFARASAAAGLLLDSPSPATNGERR
jgi:amidase